MCPVQPLVKCTTKSGGRPVAAPPPRHAGGFARRTAVVLGEDQLHRPLEHRARRPGARREPFLELRALDAEKRGELVAAALQLLALLQNARAHLCPSWLVDHAAVRASAVPSKSGQTPVGMATAYFCFHSEL